MARTADAVLVFADFERLGGGGDAPVEVPLEAGDGLGNEWAVVVDAPGYCACLLALGAAALGGRRGARPRAHVRGDVDARPARRAPGGAGRRRRSRAAPTPRSGERIEGLLAERPLAMEQPAPGLTAVTNRIVGYLDAA